MWNSEEGLMRCQDGSRMTRGRRDLNKVTIKITMKAGRKAGIEYDLPLEVPSIPATGLLVSEDWSSSSFPTNFHLQAHQRSSERSALPLTVPVTVGTRHQKQDRWIMALLFENIPCVGTRISETLGRQVCVTSLSLCNSMFL